MATSTTNLGLIKPAGTDKIRIAQINSNMDVIDTKMGAVGNTPLQTQITTLNTTADAIESGVAIRAIGNTHAAITSGQYVFVRNHSTLANGLYKASANIAANAALSTSNLAEDASGGLNSLKAGLDTLNSKIAEIKLEKPAVTNGTTSFTAPNNMTNIFALVFYAGHMSNIAHMNNSSDIYTDGFANDFTITKSEHTFTLTRNNGKSFSCLVIWFIKS